jgi:hypothetical protein
VIHPEPDFPSGIGLVKERVPHKANASCPQETTYGDTHRSQAPIITYLPSQFHEYDCHKQERHAVQHQGGSLNGLCAAISIPEELINRTAFTKQI